MKIYFTKTKASFFVMVALLFSFNAYAQVQDITTIAGNGIAGYTGDGGQATAAEIRATPNGGGGGGGGTAILGVAVDDSGNIYIADQGNNRIREVSSSGVISTVAGGAFGGGGGGDGDGGAATAARLNRPQGVAVDASGNIYIADEANDRIRKVTVSTGIIITVAGTGIPGYNGDGITATTAELDEPSGIALDAQGNIYIADEENDRIREVNISTGIISTIAGNGTVGYNGDGGPATAAILSAPTGVALDNLGNIYIADQGNNVIREIAISDTISTIAGDGTNAYSGDNGPATAAELNHPFSLAVDDSGNIYIADEGNNRIRKVNLNDTITTVAGNGTGAFAGDGGPATAAELNTPTGLAVNDSGNIYIGDATNNRIRAVYAAYPPAANFTADSIACINTPMLFTDKSYSNIANKPTSWKWTFTGGTPPTSDVEDPTVVYTALGTYSVKLVVSNAAGTDSITKTNYITINPLPTISVSPTSDTVCSGTSVTLTGSGGVTYTWAPNRALSSTTGSSVTADPTLPTTYTVTGTNANGCANTASVILTTLPGPTVTATTNSNPACEGNPITLTCKGNAVTYAWLAANGLNAITGTSATATPTSATTYFVVGTDTTNGCTDTASVAVSIYGASEFSYTVTGYEVVFTMDSVSSCISDGFQWNFSYGPVNTDDKNPAITYPSDTGIYSVCLKCYNDSTCTQCVNISVPGDYSGNTTGIKQIQKNNDPISIYPNPNNGTFFIKFGNLTGSSELDIYNILGQQVYQSTTLKNRELINLSDQVAGIYFIYLKSNENIEVGKVLITR